MAVLKYLDNGVYKPVIAPKGDKGSDANVTSANIASALGYTPASTTSVESKQDKIIAGNGITIDSDGKTINGLELDSNLNSSSKAAPADKVGELKEELVTEKIEATENTVLAYDTNGTEYSVYTDDEIDSRILDTDKCSIQWYRGGYNTTTGKWSGNSLYSEDSNTTMMHPAPMQMLKGDVVPCPDGYTVSIAIYKYWHNADDFEYTTSISRRSTPYTITASRSGYWIMPTYKTANSDIVCDSDYSFKKAGIDLIHTITPMLVGASTYHSIAKRVNFLENKMETITKAMQSLTGGVLEKFDSVSAVQYAKKNIDPDSATGFGMWLIRDTNISSMNGIPNESGHAMLINIEQKSFYAASQFYIMVSGENAGTIYVRTKNKKSWSGVAWTAIGGAT